MATNAATDLTIADWLTSLGDIPASRVRMVPPPGKATDEDLSRAHRAGGLCELIDGTLVEKATGFEASAVAIAIATILRVFVAKRLLGIVTGSDGFFRLRSSTRGPDVAFVSKERLPGGRFPTEAYPSVAPDLAVEVLSPGDTPAEMTLKRREYFDAGVLQVWIVDCSQRSVAVFSNTVAYRVYGVDETISDVPSLPGFTARVEDFFVDLDLGQRDNDRGGQ